MILAFSKLQRLSGLTKPTAVYSWLKRQGVPALRDAKGRPFTTLDAVNRRLSKSADDGFRLDDPTGRVRPKRAVLPGFEEQVDRPDAGGRRADGATQSIAGSADYEAARDRWRTA